MRHKNAISLWFVVVCIATERARELDALPASPELAMINSLQKFIDSRPGEFRKPQGTWYNCFLCKSTISIVQEFFTKSRPREDLVAVLTYGCKTFQVAAPTVCEGIIPLFERMLFEVVARSPLSPHDMCSLAFSDECGQPSVYSNWSVVRSDEKKPPVVPVPPPPAGAPVVRIAHISDTHVDAQYMPGSAVNCAEPLCCRATSTLNSAADRASAGAAGFWGTYERCDIPERTLRAAFNFITSHVRPDFVYFTGDIIPHNVWQNTREQNSAQFNRTFQLLHSLLPNVQIIPAIGNHEGVPVNSFEFDHTGATNPMGWLYNELADLWSAYIPESELKSFRRGGYFSYDLTPRLRVISLNMNFCNTFNWWILINSEDPTGQLDWLTWRLQDAERRGLKVHILGHHPPGKSDCMSVWSRNYNQILNRYEGVIAGQFYGHTHFDEFELFFDQEQRSRPFGVGYIGPSITTFVSGDPAFRVYRVDGIYDSSSYQVLDYETYYMNLQEANKNPSDFYIPEWEVYESIKELYDMPSLQPEHWLHLAKRLAVDHDLFQMFYNFYKKRLPNAKWTPSERGEILCGLLTSNSESPCRL